MRLRGQVLLWLLAVVLLPVVGMGWLGGGLIVEVALVLTDNAGTGGLTPEAAAAAVTAAQRVLWLGGAALTASTLAIALVLSRRSILAPIERVAKRLGAGPEDAELPWLERRVDELRAQAHRADLERDGHLDAVRVALDRAESQLVNAQRLGITGRLALGAAHEIGGPMSIAIAAIDASRGGAPAAEMLEAIDEALVRVDAILRELTDFGRPDDDRREAVDVYALANAVVALARLHPKVRTVNVTVAGEPGTTAQGVRRHIEQVLLNLVVNAADATERAGKVVVTVGVAGGGVRVTVDDNGPGVPDHLRDRVFEPFFTSKAHDQGSGLGLAISRRLVDLGGGSLEVDRGPLGGARFVVDLPAA